MCYIQILKGEDSSEIEDTNEGSEDDSSCSENNQSKSIAIKKPNSSIKYRYIFFDFETMQDDIHKEEENFLEYRHTPNLCVAHVLCEDCKTIDINDNPDYICKLYGNRNKVFKGESCVNEFCSYLYSPKMKNIIAIAHNAQAFDSQFIIKFLCSQGIRPQVIMKGIFKNHYYVMFTHIQ